MGCKTGTFLWLFCTPIGFRHFQITLLESMAGTTGLEPATSAVAETSNLLKLGVTDGSFWRSKTLIAPDSVRAEVLQYKGKLCRLGAIRTLATIHSQNCLGPRRNDLTL